MQKYKLCNPQKNNCTKRNAGEEKVSANWVGRIEKNAWDASQPQNFMLPLSGQVTNQNFSKSTKVWRLKIKPK